MFAISSLNSKLHDLSEAFSHASFVPALLTVIATNEQHACGQLMRLMGHI
jgi:hypothetical protein